MVALFLPCIEYINTFSKHEKTRIQYIMKHTDIAAPASKIARITCPGIMTMYSSLHPMRSGCEDTFRLLRSSYI